MVCPPPQAEFCISKGYKTDCEVIYGDTDSVMVNFKVGIKHGLMVFAVIDAAGMPVRR